MERFFAVAPPGFETETAREIREWWPDLLGADARPHALPLPELAVRKGGVEFETEPFAALQLNFFLKTASRILWRQAEFRVRDFPKLHAKLEKLDVPGRLGRADFGVKAAAAGSRLGHQGRIEETARAAWSLKAAGDENPAVYIRLQDDVCTVSLDTTGEHLHRRGLNLARGEAPLRETIAAFVLRRLIGDDAPAALAGVELIDPMCGSGTFLTEAMSLAGGHFQRPFRFQEFHGLPKLFKQPKFALNYKLPPPPLRTLAGFDADEKVLAAARANLDRAAAAFPGPRAAAEKADLFDPSPAPGAGRRWVVSNPPYGERLQGEPPQKIFDRLFVKFAPERVALVWPAEVHRALRAPAGYRLRSEDRFKNGGLDVVLGVHVKNGP